MNTLRIEVKALQAALDGMREAAARMVAENLDGAHSDNPPSSPLP